MTREAMLLGGPAPTAKDKKIPTVLSFFGMSWRALTIADFLTELTGSHLTTPNLRVLCSAEVLVRLIKDFEGSLVGRERWKEHVHSVFIHSTDDPDSLQELTVLLTGDRRGHGFQDRSWRDRCCLPINEVRPHHSRTQ